jgi:hypothetical protein
MNETNSPDFIYQFNNKNRSSGYFIVYIVSGILFLSAICYFIFSNMNLLLLITIVTAIIYFILFHLFKPSYFELLVTETELQVNFYSVATAIKSYQTVVIELEQFKGFEIRTSYIGMRKELILTVDSKFGLADYPPVNISIVNRNEISRIQKVLSQLINNEK